MGIFINAALFCTCLLGSFASAFAKKVMSLRGVVKYGYTDMRSTWACGVKAQKSIFFDERSVLTDDGKILWGLATTTGVGIYFYEPAAGASSEAPIVNTQGDPSILEHFEDQ